MTRSAAGLFQLASDSGDTLKHLEARMAQLEAWKQELELQESEVEGNALAVLFCLLLLDNH
jgi:hypothetical protein